MEIYAVHIQRKMQDETINLFMEYLSVQERGCIKGYRRWEDVQRSLVGKVLIRKLISKKFQLESKDIDFYIDKYGKPFFKAQNNCHFNISHSGEWIVCAIADHSVGIDIEEVSDIDLGIAYRFFSDQEQEDLKRLSPKEQNIYFFDLWSLKESYIKKLGMGLSIPLHSFTIRKKEMGITIDGAVEPCFFRQYAGSELERYKLSVCSKYNEFPDSLNIMSELEFEHFICDFHNRVV